MDSENSTIEQIRKLVSELPECVQEDVLAIVLALHNRHVSQTKEKTNG